MALTRLGPADLDALVASRPRVVVDVQAPWCGQCRSQEAAVERIAPDYGAEVAFGSVDLGVHPELGDRYGVSGLPAFLFFEGGRHHATVGGYQRAPQLRALIRERLGV